MKTFLTEKHNIPEGATHYEDETSYSHFAWFKLNEGELVCMPAVGGKGDWIPASFAFYKDSIKPIPQINIEAPEEKEALDLIDTTPRQYESVASKEVEWVNGELLEFNGEPCIFIGMSEGFPVVKYTNDADSTLAGEVDEIFATDMLSKPETEAERVEREKLEAAYDLYTHVQSVRGQLSCKFDWFSNSEMEEARLRFLAIVDKTNYRKESE